MISFERVDIKNISTEKLTEIGEVNVFQTLPWLNLIACLHKVEPVMVRVKSGDAVCGYFSGFILKKFGLRILGSPFRGWTTYFMGFNLMPGVSRCEVLNAFPAFAFKKLHCHYLEIIDPYFVEQMGADIPYHVEHLPWFSLDLTPDEDGLFSNMKDTGRRGVRKATKCNVSIEETSDLNFVEEYYAQYQEVMAKHSLEPTYSAEVVRQMVEHISPTGSLLLLRAKSPEGECIATALFLVLNELAIYWGGASWQEFQCLHPNELLFWHAMKALKKRGARVLHLGGEAEQFKLKLGSEDAKVFRLKKANNPLLDYALATISAPSASIRFKNWFIRKL